MSNPVTSSGFKPYVLYKTPAGKGKGKLGTCNANIWEVDSECCEFEVSLSYIVSYRLQSKVLSQKLKTKVKRQPPEVDGDSFSKYASHEGLVYKVYGETT